MARSSVDVATDIERHPGTSSRELSQRLGVSDRTVRNYIARANEALDGAARIVHERGAGYTLEINDEARYRNWVLGASTPRAVDVPETPNDRVRYLLNDLLMRADWITLDELSRVLYVSRSALSRDLKCVERILSDFDMELEKRPHYGMRIVGNEVQRRICLAHLAMDDVESNSGGGSC